MGKFDGMSDRELAVSFAADAVASYSMVREYLDDPDFDIRRVAWAILDMDRELQIPKGWVYEDELPTPLGQDAYDEWYQESKIICGVRMGPPLA